jgi:DNA-binding IclR family transcriptional regulator
MAVEEGMSQQEIGEEAGVHQATVSRAMNELRELDLVEETDNGYKKALSVLNHPVIQNLFETEFLDDSE